MSPALLKLKAKLTSRFTPADLGIVPESERELAPSRGSVGGLAYDCLPGFRHADRKIECSIEHSKRDEFFIYVIVEGATRIASNVIKFVNVDRQLMKLIAIAREEN